MNICHYRLCSASIFVERECCLLPLEIKALKLTEVLFRRAYTRWDLYPRGLITAKEKVPRKRYGSADQTTFFTSRFNFQFSFKTANSMEFISIHLERGLYSGGL